MDEIEREDDKMTFIGIDPGQKGAVSILCDACTGVFDLFDMPENIVNLYRKLKPGGSKYFCILEKAQPMPKQGVKGVFTYGVGYGKILAILEILKIPFQEVHPTKWKKEFPLYKKDKKESIKVAQQLFPNIEFYTERGRMLDGRAEALLLAEYARRIYNK